MEPKAPHVALRKTALTLLKKIQRSLWMPEICTIIIISMYLMLNVIFWGDTPKALINLLTNFIILGLTIFFALSIYIYPKVKWLEFARLIYMIPFIFIVYQQVHDYVPLINPHDYDELLMRWDYALMSVNPTQWIQQFAHPWFTEFLQLCYMMFFFMPVIHMLEMYWKKRINDQITLLYVVGGGFFFSYLLYFFLPAAGPRFSLHDYNAINSELPGIFVTEFARQVVDSGCNIAPNSTNPFLDANRDCFPSGHTMMTVLNILLAFRLKSSFRYIFLFIGTGLIISTIYLRYHYMVDLLAGLLCALLVFLTYRPIRRWFITKGFESA